MPPESQLAHRNIRDTNIPYISNQSPTVTESCYLKGSTDILTNINGYAQRRPGFSDAVEPTPTVFNNLQRVFPWDDFNGAFYVMFNDINTSGFSQVFKMQLGVDASAVSIFTDTSAAPFDFVVSNSIVYFGNTHAMKKWNPTIGIENWGIAIGSVNNAFGPNVAGNGADAGGSHPWSNPNNVTSSVSFATVTLTNGLAPPPPALPPTNSNALNATQFGFAIPSNETVTGVQITVNAHTNVLTFSALLIVSLMKNGSIVFGATKSLVVNSSSTTLTFGGTSDLWGTTWSPNDLNQTTWGVSITASVAQGGGTVGFSVNNVRATIFGVGGPIVTVNPAAGTFSATVGYEYVFTYGNSVTGHMSSPTPASNSTGIFTNKLNVQIPVTASTDPQVNQIRVFRTTDSVPIGAIGGTFFEIPNSPFPNTTATVTDNAPDTQLNIFSIAPTPTFNDPPPPSAGFVYFSGRIWMFVGNLVWFTGLEEIFNGVPEECVPSGLAGNFWKFDQPVGGLGVAGTGNNQTLLIFCGGRIYGITGQSLDTFQRFLISNRRGCRSKTTITMLGGMCAWLDSANQIWATDGNNLSELSVPIRPDLSAINPANCSMTFHTANAFHWLVFSTGTVILIYDVDTEQWMPPWSFATRYVFSGEIAPGSYQLMGSIGTKALQLNAAKFNDNGVTYQPLGRTNLFSLVPDFGRRFSYIAAGIYDEPSRTGYAVYVEVDTNKTNLADVAFITDEDPTLGTYTSLTNPISVQTAYNRTPGQFIQQNVYGTNQPSARWFGIQWKMANADQLDKVYGWFIAYKPVGGR